MLNVVERVTINVATLIVMTYICVMKIEEAIQQKQFKNVFQKAHINVIYTAAFLSHQTSVALKPYSISIQQFNILRILRGLHPEPATVKLLTERMLDKMSNASRLVEKLKQKDLVERVACPGDRRKVNVWITPKGLQLLELASLAVEKAFDINDSHITETEAGLISDLMDKMRGD